jgi:hypothetical protein
MECIGAGVVIMCVIVYVICDYMMYAVMWCDMAVSVILFVVIGDYE